MNIRDRGATQKLGRIAALLVAIERSALISKNFDPIILCRDFAITTTLATAAKEKADEHSGEHG